MPKPRVAALPGFAAPLLQAADEFRVPASSGIGMVLMILLFIGAAAYFMRRRSGK